jgi:hypothetical protein
MKYLFAPICVLHVYAVGYEVHARPPFLLIGFHSIGCQCTLINFSQYKARVYIQVSHFLWPLFRKAKCCGVPSRTILKVGCAMGKKKVAELCHRQMSNEVRVIYC